MTRAVRVRAWRCIRRVDDDDDEITAFCVQLMSNDFPFFFPLAHSSCEGGFFHFSSSRWPGRLGIFFFFKKNVLLFGSIYDPVYCPIVVAYNLLHTYPYIFNTMVGIEASLRRWLLVGIWGFLLFF